MSVSPTPFSTGILSPVSMDSSTVVAPFTITASSGMRLPGFTRMCWPFLTSPVSTSRSVPSSRTTAVSGASSMSFRMASEVFPLLRLSIYFPSITSVTTTAADS